MTISAQIIADSVSPQGHRLTTFQLRYPRFIHAEVMTHRVFSRNASSSRAIPVQRLIEDVLMDPAMPLHWGKNQKGMQARQEHAEPVQVFEHIHSRVSPQEAWLLGRYRALELARAFMKAGYHKQLVNRLLEPWAHINVVVTSTSWANFFALRHHPDAQPEIAALAGAMRQCQEESVPVLLQPGQWHLPYIREEDVDQLLTAPDEYDHTDGAIKILQMVSVARCARVSYLTHDGRPTTIEEDQALCERLVIERPLHASPAEHQATPDEPLVPGVSWAHPQEHGNFTGWRQLRKRLPGEYVADEPYSNAVPQTKVV